MKVKATMTGYYDHKRIREGQVFELKPLKTKDGKTIDVEKQFSKVWMERLDVENKKPKAKGEESFA